MIERLKSMWRKPVVIEGISQKHFPFVYESLYYFNGLMHLPQAKVFVEDGRLIFFVDDVKLSLNTKEEIFILHEIFVDDAYKFKSSKPYIFIDVGLNVGFTSVFFATDSNVHRIYGFEPFIETFDQAKFNISLNEEYAHKIIIEPIGLGAEDKDIELDYSFKFKANVGVHGINRNLIKLGIIDDLEKKTVVIRKASTVLAPILSKHKDYLIVLKMDCEGSEYEILSDLDSNGLLKQIDVIMLEWHFKGYEPLLNIFERNGFGTFVRGKNSGDVGLLLCFKQ